MKHHYVCNFSLRGWAGGAKGRIVRACIFVHFFIINFFSPFWPDPNPCWPKPILTFSLICPTWPKPILTQAYLNPYPSWPNNQPNPTHPFCHLKFELKNLWYWILLKLELLDLKFVGTWITCSFITLLINFRILV